MLYIGVTSDILRRVFEHRNNINKGYTQKYNIHKLVYFEEFNDVSQAIQREKTLKGWTRLKKIELIIKFNPNWDDLSENWY